MNLTINIDEAVNSYRLDIFDSKEGQYVVKENPETKIEMLTTVINYLNDLRDDELQNLNNAWR